MSKKDDTDIINLSYQCKGVSQNCYYLTQENLDAKTLSYRRLLGHRLGSIDQPINQPVNLSINQSFALCACYILMPHSYLKLHSPCIYKT